MPAEAGVVRVVRDDLNPAVPGSAPAGSSSVRLIWSGTLAERPFDASPRNWMQSGRVAVAHVLARVAEWASQGPLLVQPHARHLISDISSALAFARQLAEIPGAGLAFSPAALFEEAMLADAEDHLERMMSALVPVASAFVAEDLRPSANGDGLPVLTFPGQGVLPFDWAQMGIADVPVLTPEAPANGS